MKTVSLDSMIDKHIGKRGTIRREKFETKLRLDLIGSSIKKARISKKLTQVQLSELAGIQKSQVIKIENSLNDAKLETVLKVFEALDAKVNFSVNINNEKLMLAK